MPGNGVILLSGGNELQTVAFTWSRSLLGALLRTWTPAPPPAGTPLAFPAGERLPVPLHPHTGQENIATGLDTQATEVGVRTRQQGQAGTPWGGGLEAPPLFTWPLPLPRCPAPSSSSPGWG